MTSPNGKKNGKRPGGRPRKEIEPIILDDPARKTKALEQVTAMAGYGLTQNAIADVLGISHDVLTIRKREDPEVSRALEKGKAFAEAKIGEALFLLATGASVLTEDKKSVYTQLPNLGAIIWWEKTRAGRYETQRHEVTGQGGTSLIPLDTLREAVKAAEAADPQILPFRRARNGTSGP